MEEYRLFAILDENNKVFNISTFPKDASPFDIEYEDENGNLIKTTITPNPEDILLSYEGNYTLQEYDLDGIITKNPASVGSAYNKNLNAFISEKPDETYVLNTDTFEWEPDKELEYDLHNDGIMYKWIGTGWILVDKE